MSGKGQQTLWCAAKSATVFVVIVLVEYCVLKGSAYCLYWYFECGSCVNIAWHGLLHGLVYIVYESWYEQLSEILSYIV
jgi:hypothetical protein